jgi:hypothetical protein
MANDFKQYKNWDEREQHVYPVAIAINEGCGWLDEHDALEVAELLYNKGFLKHNVKEKELSK